MIHSYKVQRREKKNKNKKRQKKVCFVAIAHTHQPSGHPIVFIYIAEWAPRIER